MRRVSSKGWTRLVGIVLPVTMLVVAGCGGEERIAVTPDAAVEHVPGVETTGVTDAEIKIGTLLPMSNTLAAAWGVPISRGMKAYYDYVNDQGGIYGRTINFIVGDSQYAGPVASEVVRKLVEQERVFAIQGSLGTAAHNAVWKYLEEKGIPDMFLLTGDTKWTEPASRNRFGFLVDYITEGRILGKYIGEKYDRRRLGILAQNDDFGKEGERGIKIGLGDAGASMEISVEYYDETQTDVTAQAQRLRNQNVDVIAMYGMPAQTASLFRVCRQTLNWDVPIIVSGVDAAEVVARLAGYDNIEGTVSVVFGHQAFETEVPGIEKHLEIMAKYAPNVPVDNLTLLGATVSELMVQVLRQAGPDLATDSFLDAAASICRFVCSTCMAPSTTSSSDHRPIEVETYVIAAVDRSTDPPSFRWQPFGEAFGFESTADCVSATPPPGYGEQPE